MGSEMCIRDRSTEVAKKAKTDKAVKTEVKVEENAEATAQAPTFKKESCLLYTSDAADDMQCVDLGCRRIIKKKKKKNEFFFFKQKTAYFFFSSRRRHTR